MTDKNNIFNLNCGFGLDTSSLSTTSMTASEFNATMYSNLQTILKNTFRDCYEKQKIKKTTTGYNFACPFCRDSATDTRKKRGNITVKGSYAGRYKCYNCGKTMKLPKFFKSFNIDMTLSELNYCNNTLMSANTVDTSTGGKITGDVLDIEKAYQWAVRREDIKSLLNYKDISKEETPAAWNYLIGRCQYKNHERFLYNEKYNQIIILNLLKGDRVLGMQIRPIIKPKSGAKYLTVTLEKMRELLLKDNTPVPEEIARLSCIFNIYNVDFVHVYDKPVLVTEGPFDAFLLPNCIAISGASKNFQMPFPFWYFYDSDATGKKKSMEYIGKGYKVFMWKKFLNDYGLPYRNKWDVTDVLVYIRDNNIQKQIYWSHYFTNSPLDGLNI